MFESYLLSPFFIYFLVLILVITGSVRMQRMIRLCWTGRAGPQYFSILHTVLSVFTCADQLLAAGV